MKIAVTAASGQLGSHIVKAILALHTSDTVVALARTPEKAKNLGVEIRPGDYDNPSTLETSLQSIDTLLMVSGMDAPEKRIKQHSNVINAAKNSGVTKIVYTSIQGAEENTAFSHVVQSNRRTEDDIKNSGLEWVIGRNGIYIEPDIEYINSYKKTGVIQNCAGDKKCGYTTRSELAYAYAKMLTEAKHNGHTYNLHGEALTQYQLASYLNSTFATEIIYTPISVDAYRKERIQELGDIMGTIIAGIYQGIREGKANNPSHFMHAAGREHEKWQDYFTKIQPSM